MDTKANTIKPVRQKQAEEVMGRQAKTGPGESSHTLRSGAGRGRLELDSALAFMSHQKAGRRQGPREFTGLRAHLVTPARNYNRGTNQGL